MDENEQQLEYYIHPLPLNVFILENLEKEIKCLRKRNGTNKNTTAGDSNSDGTIIRSNSH
jgi:hypothetical protein